MGDFHLLAFPNKMRFQNEVLKRVTPPLGFNKDILSGLDQSEEGPHRHNSIHVLIVLIGSDV